MSKIRSQMFNACFCFDRKNIVVTEDTSRYHEKYCNFGFSYKNSYVKGLRRRLVFRPEGEANTLFRGLTELNDRTCLTVSRLWRGHGREGQLRHIFSFEITIATRKSNRVIAKSRFFVLIDEARHHCHTVVAENGSIGHNFFTKRKEKRYRNTKEGCYWQPANRLELKKRCLRFWLFLVVFLCH
jgi:hypothetical protein